mmetsp:Transcript_4293/g.11733  ORF Transcript_4293/g.11733 Transcript_4293/m.11733 type:complete len:325 (+) Transcript_4293:49-1023(+)
MIVVAPVCSQKQRPILQIQVFRTNVGRGNEFPIFAAAQPLVHLFRIKVVPHLQKGPINGRLGNLQLFPFTFRSFLDPSKETIESIADTAPSPRVITVVIVIIIIFQQQQSVFLHPLEPLVALLNQQRLQGHVTSRSHVPAQFGRHVAIQSFDVVRRWVGLFGFANLTLALATGRRSKSWNGEGGQCLVSVVVVLLVVVLVVAGFLDVFPTPRNTGTVGRTTTWYLVGTIVVGIATVDGRRGFPLAFPWRIHHSVQFGHDALRALPQGLPLVGPCRRQQVSMLPFVAPLLRHVVKQIETRYPTNGRIQIGNHAPDRRLVDIVQHQ